jgi:uncharacterized protein YbaR (Trm112 family)
MPPALLAEHLGLLVCPVCHAALALAGEAILCTGCARRYPIVDGLPVLIASRALAPAATTSSLPSPESASNRR